MSAVTTVVLSEHSVVKISFFMDMASPSCRTAVPVSRILPIKYFKGLFSSLYVERVTLQL